MRPVRIAVVEALTAAAAVTGSFVARSTSHHSTTPGIGVAAPPNPVADPAPPTSVAGNPGQNHPSPVPQPPGPTTTLPMGRVEALEAVQAVGTQIAFAAGKGTILTTRDGGRTWSALAAPAPPQSVCFTSPNDGWLASGIRVWRSTDGGRSWASQPNFVPRLRQYTYAPSAWLQCAATGAAWARFDSNEGVAGSSPYALYATGDGGAHWRGVLAWYGEQGVPPGPGSYLGPFSVIDPQRALLLSPTPAADSTGAVLISHGGSLLRRLPGIPRTRLSTVSEPMSVSFGSATRGWVVGTDLAGRGVILATLDGGQSWRSQLPT